jgi:hypothetical protein
MVNLGVAVGRAGNKQSCVIQLHTNQRKARTIESDKAKGDILTKLTAGCSRPTYESTRLIERALFRMRQETVSK